jgi:hypothetical protein
MSNINAKYFLEYKSVGGWYKSIDYEKGFQDLDEAQKAKSMAEGDCGYMLKYRLVGINGEVVA